MTALETHANTEAHTGEHHEKRLTLGSTARASLNGLPSASLVHVVTVAPALPG